MTNESELASLKAEVEKLKGERDEARADHIRRNNDATDFGVALRLSEARAEALEAKLDKAKEALTKIAAKKDRRHGNAYWLGPALSDEQACSLADATLSELSEARDGN